MLNRKPCTQSEFTAIMKELRAMKRKTKKAKRVGLPKHGQYRTIAILEDDYNDRLEAYELADILGGVR